MKPSSPDTLVLCYHAIGEDDASLCVSEKALERQLVTLRRRGYVSELARNVIHTAASRRVVVTFDDGFRSVSERAVSLLERLEFVATVFVTTSFVGGEVATPAPEPLHRAALSWDDLRGLVAKGWEVGSHAVSHTSLPTLNDRALNDELVESKRRIEIELGRACPSFSYPFGDMNGRVEEAVQRAGYDVAFTVPRRLVVPTAYAWPRVTVFRTDGPLVFAAKTRPTARRLRTTSAGARLGSFVGRTRRR